MKAIKPMDGNQKKSCLKMLPWIRFFPVMTDAGERLASAVPLEPQPIKALIRTDLEGEDIK